MQKHLVIIDGHHLMYRAFYAIPRTLQTASGELTNAVYGVASMLLTLLRAEEPDALVFCFDAGEETFRHQENATYKEGRAETPDEFFLQIPRIMEMLDVFRLRSVSDVKYEADDFLCAYAKVAEKAGMRTTIITGDRDALQLATPSVRIAIPHKAYQAPEYLGPDEILKKYGVRPDQIASYKGLTGDASDNLPGVRGIGPKTASELLQKYETLEKVYEHLADIKPSVRAKLEKDRDQAFFCEHMATLVCDLPIPYDLDQLALKDLPTQAAEMFFQALEFHSLRKRLQGLAASPYGQAHFQKGSAGEAVMEKVKEDERSQMQLF